MGIITCAPASGSEGGSRGCAAVREGRSRHAGPGPPAGRFNLPGDREPLSIASLTSGSAASVSIRSLVGRLPTSLSDRSCVMPLITIVLVLIVVGVILWLINNYIPMAGSIKAILNVVVVVAVAIW